MTKEQRFLKETIEAHHRDYYGRITLEISSNSDSEVENFDNNNMWLFSGEVILVYSMLGILEMQDMQSTLNWVLRCMPEKGLISRHPISTRWFRSEDHDVISHDEYNGLCFIAATGARHLADAVCEYGQEHNWIYNDLDPEDTSWRYKRQPRDICFYKAVSSQYEPTLFERLYMSAAMCLSTRSKSFKHAQGSSVVMTLYRIWALEHSGFECKFFKLAARFFRWRCKSKLGANWVYKLHDKYFWHNAKGIPLLEPLKHLAKELS